MSLETSRTLWCLIQGDTTPYDVFDIPIGANVSRLKAKIKERIQTLRDTDADKLKLFKVDIVVPIGPGDTLAQRLNDTENINRLLRLLSPEEKVKNLYPEPPLDDHLHIVVECPEIVPSIASPKRSRSATDEDGREAKRQNLGEDATAIKTRCSAIHQAIKAMPHDLDLSNPSTFTNLPFPSPLAMPPERFARNKVKNINHFEYMGRSHFQALKKRIEEPNFQDGVESIYMYGTSGSGKSYLLAALVYHLVREGQRVFYIPDCSQLLLEPEETMQTAYYFAYNDSPDITTEKVEKLIKRMKCDRDVYIIVDQVNALECTETDDCKEQKSLILGWLRNLRFNHRYIFSASPNEKSNRDAEKKQNGISVFPIFGGMDETETDCWFQWHENRQRIPRLSEKDWEHVKYLTGCMPLLLRCLFEIKEFSEPEFRSMPVLRTIESGVKIFARAKVKSPNKETYLDIMRACVQRDYVIDEDRSLYDLRHFYVDTDGFGCFTCGIAFEAMMSILQTYDNDFTN